MQINTTGATQLTTQAMSPTNTQNKIKKAVKPKIADKKGENIVVEKENQPALTLKDLEIQVRSGVTRP